MLAGVTWDEYRALRANPEYARAKLTFDGPAGGLLEIETQIGSLHESVSWWLSNLILAFTEERRIAVAGVGTFTQSREDLDRGLEADLGFYIQSLPDVPDLDAIDLEAGDPPPDLAVEVDVTSPGVSKLPIYAALGVPEVWVWSDEAIVVRRRTDAGVYEVVKESAVLPGFPVDLAAATVARRAAAPHFELLAEFRAAVTGG